MKSKLSEMSTLSSADITGEFINSALCSDMTGLSEENLNPLGNDRITNLQIVGNIQGQLKHASNVSVMQIQEANLPDDNELPTIDEKRLTNIYVTLPLNSDIKYSMNYICRLCAAVIDGNSAINIFSTDQFQENLACKINKYLPVIVYEADPFPKTVCRPCVAKLNQFHDLAEKCVLVEEQLRQTYVFDGRYLDELNKKINQKSELELLKHESDNSDQLYSMADFQYLENLDLNEGTNSGSKKEKVGDEDLVEGLKPLKENESEIKSGGINCLIDKVNVGRTNEIIKCKFCEGNVNEVKDCFDHWDRHCVENTTEFPCLICDCVETSKPNLETHFRTHFKALGELQKMTPFTNSRDKTKIRQQKLLKSKIKIFNKLSRCRKCKQILDNVEVAIEHCLKHKPPNVKFYPCVLCLNGIGKSKLKEHIAMHYPITTKSVLTCDNCNNLYPDEKTLKYHRCTKLRKFKCSQCKQGFKSEDRLKFHEDFHRNKSTFCDICKKDFKFESRIYLHFAGVHNGIREKPYCCDVCGKTFTWLTLLNSHKRTHTNERPFKCTKCDARFCSKYSLNGHMPSHDDHPQIYCDKCDYHTGRKQNLQNHVSRFHKEISSSQICIRCRICNEIFPNRHHVDVEGHSTRHTEPEINSANIALDPENDSPVNPADTLQELIVTKLFQCERCERCFSSLDHLTHHRRSHEMNDTNSFYQCRLCDSSFNKHDLLVKHQKIHVRITSQYTSKLSVLIVISCDICGMECVDYRQLLNHKDRANCMMKKITGTLRPRKVLIKKHLQPLKTHQLFVNSNGLFECPSCQRTYKNRRRYRLHLATHSNTVL